MSDIGPRRTIDMRPGARPAQPQAAPTQVAKPAPQPRPVAAQPQAAPAAVRAAGVPRTAAAAVPAQAKPKSSGSWKVVMQFIIGLLVIAGVAAAIVALYVRYYQG